MASLVFRICQLAKRLRLNSKGSLSKIIQTLLSRQNCWVTCIVVTCWAPEYIHHAVVQSLSRIISSCNEIMWIQSILNLILVFRIIPSKFKIAEYKKGIMFLTAYYKKCFLGAQLIMNQLWFCHWKQNLVKGLQWEIQADVWWPLSSRTNDCYVC